MDTILLRLFQRQVAFQCDVAVIAAADLNRALLASQKDQVPLWAAIQSLLTAAANISKACWGQGGKYEAQRRPLRDSLEIDSSCPLRDVWMRNRFDHFDEALDDWWRKSTNHNHLDMMVGPPSAASGLEDVEMFRVLNPETLEVVFWGKRLNLQTILSELERIREVAGRQATLPHWDP